jgi:hypothetical protein
MEYSCYTKTYNLFKNKYGSFVLVVSCAYSQSTPKGRCVGISGNQTAQDK